MSGQFHIRFSLNCNSTIGTRRISACCDGTPAGKAPIVTKARHAPNTDQISGGNSGPEAEAVRCSADAVISGEQEDQPCGERRRGMLTTCWKSP